ncbi:MAG: DoxX family protein [Halobacteriaceae archaeon]
MTIDSIIFLGLQGLLGMFMLGSGGTKLVGIDMQVENFDHFGYPQWFRILIGGIEVLGALYLMVAFITVPTFALAGSFLITIILLGAILTHIRVGDTIKEIALPTILLGVTITVALYHAYKFI